MGLFFGGCVGTAWEEVRRSKDVDQLQRFIRQHPDHHIQVAEARRRIELLEYRAAIRANSRYDYRLFLERHPHSAHAPALRRRLEELEFALLKKEPTRARAEAYLKAWPKGRHLDEVNRILDRILCARWRETTDPEGLTRLLDDHPGIACLRELESRRQALLFERARTASGARRLVEFIGQYPKGQLARRARARLTELHVQALIGAARFDRAREIIRHKAAARQMPALITRVEKARNQWILSTYDPGQIRRHAATLDPPLSKEFRKRAAALARHRGTRPLARATDLLRSPLLDHRIGDSTLADPRRRWIEARTLALSPDEETANYLLDLLSDSFLEVRRSALLSLRAVVAGLGAVRTQIWAGREKNRLLPRARSGLLLLKLGVLANLLDRPAEAYAHIEPLLRAGADEDLFALYLALNLSRRTGESRRAATLAARFCAAASAYAEERTRTWNDPDGLRASQSGWLSLRQLHGLVKLWRQVLAVDPQEDWVGRARADLKKLAAWLADQERRWAEKHPDYRQSNQPGDEKPPGQPAQEREAILRLAGHIGARTTLEFVACCHARPENRALAGTVLTASGLVFPWVHHSRGP